MPKRLLVTPSGHRWTIMLAYRVGAAISDASGLIGPSCVS